MANWEVVIEGRQGTNDMLNVFHYASSGVEPPDWGAAASVVKGHLEDHIAPICGSRVTWTGITVRADVVGGVGTFIPFPTGTLTGTEVSGDQMDQAAVYVKKLSGGLIRPTYGWFFQGGITVRATDAASLWEVAFRTAVLDYAIDMRVLNIAGPTTLTMQIKASNPTAPNTQAYSVVNSFIVGGAPRALRSRRNNIGS